MSKFLMTLAATALLSVNVFADNTTAKVQFEAAKVAFDARVAFAKDEVSIDQSAKALEAALSENPTGDLRFEILNFYTRVLVWKGMHTTSKQVEDVYDLAMKKADEARKMSGYEGKAEGHYWYSVALGRWALAKGPLTVLGRVGEMKSALDEAANGETLAGDLGETVDFYGPDRVYGRLYMELPAIAGGSNKKAVQHLAIAYAAAPEYTLNALYYAQALDATKETSNACTVIAELLGKDPLKLIPDRAQEATEDFADAKKFQAEKCVN